MFETYMIQAILGDSFEDLYIEAQSVEQAIEIAKRITALQHRFTRFAF